MDIWQAAVRLFRHEVGRSWGGLLTTILFFVYFSLVMSPVLRDLIRDNDGGGSSSWIGDFLYVTLMPCLGFMMSRGMMKYWQNDPYTRKLAYWRTLPISLTSIVLARLLQQAVVLLIVAFFFFGVQYAFVKELRGMLNIGEYMLFILIWLGYSLAIGSSYIYFEQTVSGRQYLIVCIAYLVLYVIVVLGLRLSGVALLMETLQAAERHTIWLPAGMAIVGIAVMIASGIMLRKRLAVRSLLG